MVSIRLPLALSLPTYEVLEFSSEDLAVKDEFYLVFLNTIVDNRAVKIRDRLTDRLSQSLEKSSYNNRVAT